ncbi:MAG: 5'/3'-nucleotidase SurE [Chitinophagales bacterium]|nr:5'/3'-nucleotidase SurE [Chitinophagales bacterium]MCZ2392243.1 5'/3'-nucleotidase SurE [Chitinophagales bacterium]
MTNERPVILVTNDDGIISPGIKALVEVASEFGQVVVVAPDSPQSGMGHAITLENVLRIERVHLFGDEILAYQCSGTPVDCVKIAINKIIKKKPDLCLSGINHGSNSSINVIYSGTLSAAMEASIDGVKAIGFSLLDYSFEADFQGAQHFARLIIQQILENGLPSGCLLNVNIPKLPVNDILGVKVCRQAMAQWEEEYDERIDPRGGTYYWLTGKFVNYDNGEDTDEWALANGYVSIVPVEYDLTNQHGIRFLNKHWNI